ncbi:pilus assembly protein TadG-related protein [Streptomyces ziwulingensis]|uniref:Pilus assembly protein TadG-related protein n=1 Tax=Streptomyces ziwulingensis TaxID=1045501 RepID=A0ABP9AR33_9ACTN
MRRVRHYGDTGQALPIYVVVVGGLLFLAFAYLAVGQAAANRSDTQTAADAAALAVALEDRDVLAAGWLENVLDPAEWQDYLDGNALVGGPACGRASRLAARNEADLGQCYSPEPLRYMVEVTSREPVGDTIVPGTESRHSTASATAVIEPRCTFDEPGEEAQEEVPEEAAEETLPALVCGDEEWELDPEDLSDLPGPEDLFDVHLAD